MQLLNESIPLVLLSFLGSTGCPSSSSTEVASGDVDLSVTIDGEGDRRTLDVRHAAGGPPAGEANLRFLDAQGLTVGTWTGRLPLTGHPVPREAVRWHLVAPSGTDEWAGLNDSGVITLAAWLLAGGPLEPDPLGGTVRYATTVRAVTRPRAEGVLADLLAATRPNGATGELPAGVYRIHQLLHTHVEGEAVVFTHSGSTPFEDLELDVGEHRNYATLDDAELLQVGDVHRARLSVPLADLDVAAPAGTSRTNRTAMRVRNAGGPRVRMSGEWTFTSL